MIQYPHPGPKPHICPWSTRYPCTQELQCIAALAVIKYGMGVNNIVRRVVVAGVRPSASSVITTVHRLQFGHTAVAIGGFEIH